MSQMKIHQGQKRVMMQCRRWLGLSSCTYVTRCVGGGGGEGGKEGQGKREKGGGEMER